MFTVTPQFDRLIRGSDELPLGLWQLYFTTAEQLGRPFYSPKAITYVKEMLKTLEDNGFVRHGIIPTLTSGTPFYYMIGREGVRYLRRIGYEEAYLPDMPKADYPGHYKHQFELNDLVASGVSVPSNAKQFYVHRLIPEHVMKRDPRLELTPDGFLDFGVRSTELKRGILLEYDRDSEKRVKFQQKIRAYIEFLHHEAYREEPFRTQSIIVAFCTPDDLTRRDEMRQWTYQELYKTGASAEVCYAFKFASIAKPFGSDIWLEPIWYTSFDTPPQALLAI